MLELEEIGGLMNDVFIIALKIAGPSLLISMIVGVLISILQAATQVHEQTLTFVPKLITIGIVLLLTSGHIMSTLTEFAVRIFSLL